MDGSGGGGGSDIGLGGGGDCSSGGDSVGGGGDSIGSGDKGSGTRAKFMDDVKGFSFTGSGHNTRSSASRRASPNTSSVLHSNIMEMCWDSDERMCEASYFLEHNEWPDEDESIQLSLLYAAYGENALSGSLPDDVINIFFSAKKSEPKYPKCLRDEEFAAEWEPAVRKEVDDLKAGKRLWRLTKIQKKN